MRTFRVMSTLQYLNSGPYVALPIVAFASIIGIIWCVQCNHNKVIKAICRCGIVLAVFGVFIIVVGYAASLDALKYTHGSQKVMATITDIDEEYDFASEYTTYTYTLEFPYEEQLISVKMRPDGRVALDQGDLIEVYFYPEEPGSEREPIVVAVDMEQQLAKKNIFVGCVSCFAGLFFLYLSRCKKKLLSDGFHTSATIMQIAGGLSGKTLICNGRNPATGMIQTFKTKGKSSDFILRNEGDIVHVFIHKKNSNFYLIDI